MKEKIARIEEAVNYESAIEIISQELCSMGLVTLKIELANLVRNEPDNFVVVPIMNGGYRVGHDLGTSIGLNINPMKMSYYDTSNQRMSEPRCETLPHVSKIIVNNKVRHVVFAEGVVESEGTVTKAMEEINKLVDLKCIQDKTIYPYPIYHTFALISKVNGNPRVPNFVYSFKVNPDIWVHGWGVDNAQKGRDLNSIYGVLSPYANGVPQKPYFQTSVFYNKYFTPSI